MKKIAFFYTAWTDSGEKLVKAAKKEEIDLVPIHYSALKIEGIQKEWEIYFQDQPLKDFSLFYFRSVGDKNEHLPLLLEYAKEHKIPIVDDYLNKLGGAFRKRKSSEAIMLLRAGVSYPKSSFVSDREDLKKVVEAEPKPVVIKSTAGRHGQGTFLIEDDLALNRVLQGRTSINFLIQDYIPNDGDYRLFLVGYKVITGFKRQAKEKQLILNRSAGSSQILEKIPEDVAAEAEKAAKILGVEIAGVDLVMDKRNNKPVVIEVNQAPEFYVMEKRANLDIAQLIVKYLKEKSKKSE
ncbi:MAG: ATP-grasp domain-containing protein [Candidatus Shapirobacteria bacterium]